MQAGLLRSTAGLAALLALSATAAHAQGALRAGQTVSGTLARSDTRMDDGSYYDVFTYRGRAGEQVTVVMRSGAFDTYLSLGRQGDTYEQLASDDDGDGGTNSKVEFTLPADGVYAIRANSLRRDQTGAYTLQLQSSGGGAAPVRPGPSGPSGPVARGGDRVERGTLGPGDGTLQTGEYRDSYTLRGRAGERVVLDMRSRDMDPYLILIMPGGTQEENDDYEGDANRSLISVELPQDGEYRVLATTYRPRTSGSYELRISQGGGGEGTPSAGAARRERGRLQAGDDRLTSGEYRDIYNVQATPGQRLRADASSTEFDTYVMVIDPRNRQTENDDADGQPGHAIVDMETTEGGNYRVVVTSYRPAETGAYELSIDLGAPSSGTSAAARDVADLTLGRSVSGRLADGDRTLTSGEFSDSYVVDGQPGQVLVVEMNSSEFDPYLIVRTPDGQSIENDDDAGSSSRSKVEVPMTDAGRYRVVATSYRPREAGSYTLTARAGGRSNVPVSSPTRPSNPTTQPSNPTRPSNPTAAGRVSSGRPRGTGRGGNIYGIFVGISDYGGRANNLPYTARDARTMRESLVRGVGMRPENAIVLTDRQATVAAVRNAIRTQGAKLGPNDILVFFHSGHGGRVPTRGYDDDDPDNLDETIEMFDASIRDDELAEMLNPIQTGMVMLVIDACFSGGFSKDVINRPNRMGFFSSEEDVVSAVASKFQAGGFLPVFFAEAVGDGAGDVEDESLEPRRDGQLSLLELSQYLHSRYGTEVKSSDPGGGGRPSQEGVARRDLGYQHLVVDRGGVDAYTVLFRW